MKFRSLIPLLLPLILPSPIRFEKFNLLYAEESASKDSSNSENEQKIVTVEWDKIKSIFERTHKLSSEELAEKYHPVTPESLRRVLSKVTGRTPGYGEKINFWTKSAPGMLTQLMEGVYMGMIFTRVTEDGHQIDVVLEGPERRLEYSFSMAIPEKKAEELWQKTIKYYKELIEGEGGRAELVYHRGGWALKIMFDHVTVEEVAQKLARIGRQMAEYMSRLALEEGDYVKVYKRTVEADGKSYDVAAVVVHVYSAERVGHDTYDFMVVIKARDGQEVYHAIFTMRLPKGQELLDVAIDNPTDITVEGSSKEVGVFPIAALIKDEETERIFIKGAFISIQNAGEGGRAKIYWPSPPIDEIVVTGLR